jgi:hypothetical protein
MTLSYRIQVDYPRILVLLGRSGPAAARRVLGYLHPRDLIPGSDSE